MLKKHALCSKRCSKKLIIKNIKLLKYISENGKILPSRITNVSQKNKKNYLYQLKELEI